MALVMTSAGARLNPSAAQSYEALNEAFTKKFGKRLSISSGARTYEDQVKIFTTNHQLTPIRWSNGKYITRKWQGKTWYLKPGYATAAVPGTSNHEDPPGRAADFGSGVQTRGSKEHNWMLAHAGDYGWEWTGGTFVTIEPWHWEKTGSFSGGGSTPVDPPKPEPEPEPKDKDMDYLFQVDPATDGRWVIANYRRGTMRVIPNGFQLDQLRAEKSMKDAEPLYEYLGPQPPDRIAGLRII